MEVTKQYKNTQYEVSNTGRVVNTQTGRQLSPTERSDGYYTVGLNLTGENKVYYLHRIVAEVFCKKPDGCDEVNHIDCDKSNNHADNLEWVTRGQNQQHASDSSRWGYKKVPRKDVPDIVQHYKDGKSLAWLQEKYGLPQSRLSGVLTGKYHSDITGFTEDDNPLRSYKKNYLSDEVKQKIKDEIGKGLSYRDLAEKYNTSKDMVYRINKGTA